MANVKISELTALTPPAATDLVPVTDSSASQTKRTTVGEIVGIINGDVDVADDGTATISELPVSKLQDGAARQLLQTDAAGTGVEWTDNVDVPGTLDVTSTTTLDAALNVAGLASLDGGIDVDGAFTVANTSGDIATTGTLSVTGQSTLASAAVSDLTSGRVVLAGTSGELEDSAGLTFNGAQLDVGGNVAVAGAVVFEGSTADNFETTLAVNDPTADRTITLPDVSGTVVTTGDTGSVTSTMIADGTIVDADVSATAEIAVSKLANGTANQVLVTDGTNVSWSDDLTIAGNLTVNGNTTTVNTETLVVEDKNIELGVVGTPTDLTADGGGITLKGSTDKTINWVNATDAWTSSERFSVPLGTEAAPSLTFTGDPNTGIYSPGADQLALSANGTERARIDSSGRFLVGTSTARANFDNATSATGVLIESNSNQSASLGIVANSNSLASNGGRLILARSEGTVPGSNALVANNDKLGTISCQGHDGTEFVESARIAAEVDGTPGANDMPGRLVFSVTANGASSPTEALRISNDRSIKVSDGGNIAVGTTTGTKIGTATNQKIGFFGTTPVVQPTTGVAETAFVENSGGTAVNVDSTFGGYTLQQVVQALQNLGILA